MGPTLNARPTPRQLSALVALLALSSCQLVSCPGEPCPRPEFFEISGNLIDAQGNVVPISSATATQAGQPLRCGQPFSDAGFDEPSPQNVGIFGCPVQNVGTVEVTLVAQGRTATARAEITEQRLKGCSTPSLWAEWPEIEGPGIVLPGPGCPPASGTAIEGRLLDAQGDPVDATLTVYHRNSSRSCTTSRGHYECPALSPYATHYLLRGSMESTQIERVVAVTAEDCQPSTTELDVDLSNGACSGEPQPALAVNFYVQCPPDAPEPTARASADGGDFASCDMTFNNPWRDRCLFTATCPALTPTGGGTYTLELRQGSDIATVERVVQDDGCSPFTNRDHAPDVFD